MAVTPVRNVGSGSGSKRLVWGPGRFLPAAFAKLRRIHRSETKVGQRDLMIGSANTPTSSLAIPRETSITFSAPKVFTSFAFTRSVCLGSWQTTGVDLSSSIVTVAALSGGRP